MENQNLANTIQNVGTTSRMPSTQYLQPFLVHHYTWIGPYTEEQQTHAQILPYDGVRLIQELMATRAIAQIADDKVMSYGQKIHEIMQWRHLGPTMAILPVFHAYLSGQTGRRTAAETIRRAIDDQPMENDNVISDIIFQIIWQARQIAWTEDQKQNMLVDLVKTVLDQTMSISLRYSIEEELRDKIELCSLDQPLSDLVIEHDIYLNFHCFCARLTRAGVVPLGVANEAMLDWASSVTLRNRSDLGLSYQTYCKTVAAFVIFGGMVVLDGNPRLLRQDDDLKADPMD